MRAYRIAGDAMYNERCALRGSGTRLIKRSSWKRERERARRRQPEYQPETAIQRGDRAARDLPFRVQLEGGGIHVLQFFSSQETAIWNIKNLCRTNLYAQHLYGHVHTVIWVIYKDKCKMKKEILNLRLVKITYLRLKRKPIKLF